jgi:hypothetical protein
MVHHTEASAVLHWWDQHRLCCSCWRCNSSPSNLGWMFDARLEANTGPRVGKDTHSSRASTVALQSALCLRKGRTLFRRENEAPERSGIAVEHSELLRPTIGTLTGALFASIWGDESRKLALAGYQPLGRCPVLWMT